MMLDTKLFRLNLSDTLFIYNSRWHLSHSDLTFYILLRIESIQLKELYSKSSISPKKIKELQDRMDRDATQQTPTEILDQYTSSEELMACSRVLKKGKLAASEVLIPNEFLKLSEKYAVR